MKNRAYITYGILSFLFIVALFDLPYGYYMLLRLITSGVCVYSVVKFKTEWAKWIFGGLAVLYNPILPVHLGDKEVWEVINLATVAYIWFALWAENRKAKPSA